MASAKTLDKGIFFAGVFEYGSVAKAAKAFGIPRTTYSDILRAGKAGGKSKPTAKVSEDTAGKVLGRIADLDWYEKERLRKAAALFNQRLSFNQLNGLRADHSEDSFYVKENLTEAARQYKKEPKKRNAKLVHALRQIDTP